MDLVVDSLARDLVGHIDPLLLRSLQQVLARKDVLVLKLSGQAGELLVELVQNRQDMRFERSIVSFGFGLASSLGFGCLHENQRRGKNAITQPAFPFPRELREYPSMISPSSPMTYRQSAEPRKIDARHSPLLVASIWSFVAMIVLCYRRVPELWTWQKVASHSI